MTRLIHNPKPLAALSCGCALFAMVFTACYSATSGETYLGEDDADEIRPMAVTQVETVVYEVSCVEDTIDIDDGQGNKVVFAKIPVDVSSDTLLMISFWERYYSDPPVADFARGKWSIGPPALGLIDDEGDDYVRCGRNWKEAGPLQIPEKVAVTILQPSGSAARAVAPQ